MSVSSINTSLAAIIGNASARPVFNPAARDVFAGTPYADGDIVSLSDEAVQALNAIKTDAVRTERGVKDASAGQIVLNDVDVPILNPKTAEIDPTTTKIPLTDKFGSAIKDTSLPPREESFSTNVVNSSYDTIKNPDTTTKEVVVGGVDVPAFDPFSTMKVPPKSPPIEEPAPASDTKEISLFDVEVPILGPHGSVKDTRTPFAVQAPGEIVDEMPYSPVDITA